MGFVKTFSCGQHAEGDSVILRPTVIISMIYAKDSFFFLNATVTCVFSFLFQPHVGFPQFISYLLVLFLQPAVSH